MSDRPFPLTHHLEELRWRLIRCLTVLAVLSIALFFFSEPVLAWLARPVGRFIFTSPTEAFLVRFKIAAGLAVIVGFPYFLFELWRFIGLALRSTERKWVVLAVPAAAFLFYLGLAAAVLVVAPKAMVFLMSFSSPELHPMISIESYLSFLFWMIIGFGVLFQLPLVMAGLMATGLVAPHQFASYRRHIIVGIFIVAALLTPGPDIVSQLILAVPTYALFEIALLVGRATVRRRTAN